MTHSPVVPTTLTVREWRDPVLTARGIRADGIYTAVVWGGIIGPTATVELRLFQQLTTDGRVAEITPEELASTVGVSPSVALRAIDRLRRFGFLHRTGDTISVRHFVDLVTEARLAKLSALAQRVDNAYRQRITSSAPQP